MPHSAIAACTSAAFAFREVGGVEGSLQLRSASGCSAGGFAPRSPWVTLQRPRFGLSGMRAIPTHKQCDELRPTSPSLCAFSAHTSRWSWTSRACSTTQAHERRHSVVAEGGGATVRTVDFARRAEAPAVCAQRRHWRLRRSCKRFSCFRRVRSWRSRQLRWAACLSSTAALCSPSAPFAAWKWITPSAIRRKLLRSSIGDWAGERGCCDSSHHGLPAGPRQHSLATWRAHGEALALTIA